MPAFPTINGEGDYWCLGKEIDSPGRLLVFKTLREWLDTLVLQRMYSMKGRWEIYQTIHETALYTPTEIMDIVKSGYPIECFNRWNIDLASIPPSQNPEAPVNRPPEIVSPLPNEGP
jgi:hypothetical protein